jgi:hypothetical protein
MAMEYIQTARIESGHPYGLPPTSEVYKDVHQNVRQNDGGQF